MTATPSAISNRATLKVHADYLAGRINLAELTSEMALILAEHRSRCAGCLDCKE